MAHTFSCLYYHVVFSTAGRGNLIPQDNLSRLHGYIAGIVKNIKGIALEVGGTANHLHALLSLSPHTSISKAVNVIKSNSSKWVHETFPSMTEFRWQEGYSVFSVSRSNVEAVAKYVCNQPIRHHTTSFEDEILALLQKHGIEYDKAKVLDTG